MDSRIFAVFTNPLIIVSILLTLAVVVFFIVLIVRVVKGILGMKKLPELKLQEASRMRCTSCGNEHDKGNKVCPACGATAYTPSSEFSDAFVSAVSECYAASYDAEQITQVIEEKQAECKAMSNFQYMIKGGAFSKENLYIGKLQLQRSKVIKERFDPNYDRAVNLAKQQKENPKYEEVINSLSQISTIVREYHAGRLTIKGMGQITKAQIQSMAPVLIGMGVLTMGVVGAISGAVGAASQSVGGTRHEVTNWDGTTYRETR